MSAAAHALSMRRHVMRMMLLACAAVLTLTTGALFTREVLTYRDTALQQLAILARAVAANSTASLAFDNAEDARGVLEALRADPGIVAAGLYKTGGGLFASYPANAAPADFPADLPARASYRVEAGHLVGTQPVVEGQHVLGTLLVKADTRAMRQRLILYGQTLVLVIAASAVLALLLSRRLQHSVSAPILELAHAATDVAHRRQYSLRMAETNITEIDQLAGAFSAMMAEIQHSETQLRGQLGALNLLQRITHAIGSRQDLRDIFGVVLQTLERDLPVNFAAVAVRADDDGDFSIAALGASSLALAREMELDVGCVLRASDWGTDLAGRRPLIHEPDTAEAAAALPARFASAGLHSLVIAPLADRKPGHRPAHRGAAQAHRVHQPDLRIPAPARRARGAGRAPGEPARRLKQAYDELRQSQHTVMQQERLRALGQMASGIAHDINNAISPVSLYTESLLEREPGLSPRAREYLTTIQRAIEDVAGTVARMREFYRPRETQLTLARVDVNRLVEQVLQLTQARWSNLPQQRGIFVELRKELSPVPLQIMGAEGELRDALTNLLFNAVDAMPDGGVLTVRTAEIRGGEDTWPRVEICVGDTGIGMDEETRRRCLEPFFTTKGERGTGLGLAMVYGAVQRHSAELGIDSEPGRGTVFRLSFAASVDAVPPLAQRHAPQLPPRQRMLVVDDDPVLIRSLTDILEGDGHDVTPAGGGQAGIDAFTGALRGRAPFTMVITDLGMPHVDGRRVAAAVKALSPQTPVLMLTGWGQRLLAENDIPPHVDIVLSKPPRVSDLRGAMLKLAGEGDGVGAQRGAQEFPGMTGRLLIVDDEAAHMRALCNTLQMEGYETTGFESAAQALAELRPGEFELLLTDLLMPEIGGLDLLRAARDVDPDLVGVIMTGHGTIDTAVAAIQLGAFDYIQKPFRLNAILPMIARALEARRLRIENAQLQQREHLRAEELAAAYRDLESFAYSVSHDLRAPLRAVDGFCQLFVAEYGDGVPPEGRRLLDQVLSGTARMARLIEDLLRFSRYSSQPLKRSDIDVDALARRVVAPLRELHSATQVDFGELPPCRGDESLLEQVFANLVSNAFKFTGQRTDARIEIGSVVASLASPGPLERVYFVRDNGAGFDPAYAHKLFGVFQRLHSDRQFEGTGVGLSIVQRIVQRHGGRIWATGAPNQGATFHFTLPVSP